MTGPHRLSVAADLENHQFGEGVLLVDLAWFIAAFDRASALCRDFAQQLLIESLPLSLRFNFRAARRTPGIDGTIKFLGGRLLAPEHLLGIEPVRARKYLWVDGKVPRWVNLSVVAADTDHTYIEVVVCDRLRDDPNALYHQCEGNPPFHVLGPSLPPCWESLEASGRFSLGSDTLSPQQMNGASEIAPGASTPNSNDETITPN